MKPLMLNVKPFQETLNGSFCGPASLKIVTDYYGFNQTEAELAFLSGKDDILGTNGQSLKKVAEGLGLKVEIKDKAEFGDIETWLEKGVPLILDWFTKGRRDDPEDGVADGHYSVAIGLDDDFIYLQDPEVGRVRKINREDFYRVWFDFSSNNIEKWEDLIVRQIIAIYK